MEVQLSLFDGTVCLRCFLWQPFSQYYPDKTKKSGTRRVCKTCELKRAKLKTAALIALRPPKPSPISPTGGKICNRCFLWLPYDSFSKNPTKPDGRFYSCKPCVNERARQNRSEERAKRPPKPNPISPTGGKVCRDCKAWKLYSNFFASRRNGDGFFAMCKKCHVLMAKDWFRRNRAAANRYARRYARANPEKVVAAYHRRRARLLECEGDYTAQEWKSLCEKYGNRCLCCGSQGLLTVDHVVPIVKGGSNYITNLQPLCKSCNSAKHVKETDYRPIR